MLKLFHKALSLALVTGLAFSEFSCTKEYDISDPNSVSHLSTDVATLQRLYTDRKYEAKINSTQNNQSSLAKAWKWHPLWDQAIKKNANDLTKYVYIPLEPRVPTQPHTVTLIGSKRYLCIRTSGNRIEFNTVTYIYNEAELNKTKYNNSLWINNFYSKFTGTVIMHSLDTDNEFYFTYNEGKKTQQKITKNSNTSKSQGNSNKTANCQYYYTCYWSGYCASNYTTYGTITSGFNYCYEPDPNTGMCQYDVRWEQTRRDVQSYCTPGPTPDPDPTPDPTPDPGPGPDPVQTPPTPCQGMRSLGQNSTFQNAEASLIARANSPLEHGYAYNDSKNPSSYVYSAQGPNDEYLNLQYSGKIEGDMHTHPPGGLLFFSGTDLQAMYNAIVQQKVTDPLVYTSTIFGADGQDYAIRIENLQNFLEFGSTWLTSDDRVRLLESQYYTNKPSGISINTASVTTREKTALSMLRGEKSGLTVLKHDRTSNSWNQLGLDTNGNVITVPCP